MKWFGNLLIYGGLYIVYMGSFGASIYSTSDFLMHCLIGFPIVLAGSALVGRAAREEQVDDDATAGSISASMPVVPDATAVRARYFLYLRPFDSTNRFRLADAHMNFFSWEIWQRDGHDDLERVLAQALKPTAPLVCLGQPDSNRGAGKIATSEETWREEVAKLAHGATLIFVMPAVNAGTLWELEFLKTNGLLAKCLFIAPPLDGSIFKVPADAAHRWQQAAEACDAIGLQLVQCSEAAAVFKCGPNGEVVYSQSLPMPDPLKWMRALQMAIDA